MHNIAESPNSVKKRIIPICTFRNRFDNRPRAEQWGHVHLVKLLTTHIRRDGKDGPMFSPAKYAPGATRGNANVVAITLLAGEFDHSDYDEVIGWLDEFEYIVYSTHSSTPEAPRFRVVIFLTHPVTIAEYAEFRRRADHHIFHNQSDPATKDPARMYYFPSCQPDALCFAFYHEGRQLDPEELPPVVGSNGATYEQKAPIPETVGQGERRMAALRMAGAMRNVGADVDEIFAALVVLNKRFDPPAAEDDGTSASLRYIAESVCKLYQPTTKPPHVIQPPQPQPAAAKGPQIISAPNLMKLTFRPPRFVVPNVIPEGMTILASRPKLGKTWATLDIALAKAFGGKALGSISVDAGDVLYLALEDGDRRIQSRLALMLGESAAPERLDFAYSWPTIDEGGLEELEKWIDSRKDPALIVIDTIKRLRPRERGNRSMYNQDYDAIAPLADLSHRRGVAIITNHHTRKMEADDALDMVSGTLGLTGAADNIIVLKRERGQADGVLHIMGRDIEDCEKALQWDAPHWKLMGNADDYRRSSERNAIIQLCRESKEPIGPKQAADILGKNPNTTKVLMWKLGNEGILNSINGRYVLNVNPVNRINPVDDVDRVNGARVTQVTAFTGLHGLRTSVVDPGCLDHVRRLAELQKFPYVVLRQADGSSRGAVAAGRPDWELFLADPSPEDLKAALANLEARSRGEVIR